MPLWAEAISANANTRAAREFMELNRKRVEGRGWGSVVADR